MVSLDDKETAFNWDFFYRSPNQVHNYLSLSKEVEACLHLIDVSTFSKDNHIELVMDGEKSRAVAFIQSDFS